MRIRSANGLGGEEDELGAYGLAGRGGVDGDAGEFFGDPQPEVADLAGEILDGQVGGRVGDVEDDGRLRLDSYGDGQGDRDGAVGEGVGDHQD